MRRLLRLYACKLGHHDTYVRSGYIHRVDYSEWACRRPGCKWTRALSWNCGANWL